MLTLIMALFFFSDMNDDFEDEGYQAELQSKGFRFMATIARAL